MSLTDFRVGGLFALGLVCLAVFGGIADQWILGLAFFVAFVVAAVHVYHSESPDR